MLRVGSGKRSSEVALTRKSNATSHPELKIRLQRPENDTDLFFVTYFVGALLTLFRNPIFGIYTYLFTFYMSPNHSWWRHDIPQLRYLLIIGVITLAATLAKSSEDSRPGWLEHRGSKLFLILVLWMWCQNFWAVDQAEHFDGTVEYSKHLLIFYLIYKLFDTREKIRTFLLVHLVGCFWFGYLALGASGGRLESIGGPVGGANELAQHVATAMITGGMMWLILKGWQRWLIFVCIPFVANTIILTVSRGAFLGFFAAGAIGAFFIPKGYRAPYLNLGILALVLLTLLAHDDLKERFLGTFAAFTDEEQELDQSAQSRSVIFKAGIQIGLDHPFGAGYRGTRALSPQYMPAWALTSTGGRSAHNTFAAAFSEHGYPGATSYVLLVLWVFMLLFKISKARPNLMSAEDKTLVVALIAALISMYVSGNFSNNLFTETQYWLLALLCSYLSLTLNATTTTQANQSANP